MLWFCCLPVASLIVGRVQRSNLSKSGSEAHYSSTFTIMIKTKIHPHAVLVHGWSLFWFIKAKKITDIPQTQAGFKAKSLGILCGFQGFLTQNPAAFVEIDDIFAFSDTPWDRGLSVSLGSAGSFYFASGWFGRGNILDFWWVGMMAWDGFLCRVVGRNFPLRIMISHTSTP